MYLALYIHTHRCTCVERSVVRNQLTWSRRLGCPRSAICKLETRRSWWWRCPIRGRKLLNQQHGCCERAGESAALRTRLRRCRLGQGGGSAALGRPPLPARLSSVSLEGWADAPPHWGPVCVLGGRWLNSALRLQPPPETLSQMLRSHVQPKTWAAVTQST